MIVFVPSTRDLRRAADNVLRIVALTEHMPDDSPHDAALRDRLELAAADLVRGLQKLKGRS